MPSLAELAAIWKPYPNHNIAILTGQRSGVVVADVDPRHGGTLDALWELGWPRETPTARSGGGGWHSYAVCPDGGLASLPDYGPGIELKADGALVIAPPSVHPDTKRRYEWLEGYAPWEMPLAPLPGQLVDEVRARKPSQSHHKPRAPEELDDPGQLAYSPEVTLRLATRIVNQAMERASLQRADRKHRNDTAYWMGQQLGSLGLTRKEVAALAKLYERVMRYGE